MKQLILISCAIALLSSCTSGKKGSGTSTSSASSTAAPVANSSNGVIQLNWSAGSGISSGYYVEQSTDGTNWSQIKTVSTNSASITGATYGQKYYFRVRAYNSAGISSYSGVATVTP